jgi:hypothetical protein
VIGDQPARQIEIEVVETQWQKLPPTRYQSAADGHARGKGQAAPTADIRASKANP